MKYLVSFSSTKDAKINGYEEQHVYFNDKPVLKGNYGLYILLEEVKG